MGLTTLPTDPDALLRWAYAQHMTNGDASRDVVVYLMLNHVLRENVLPPELEAAIFRAMKRLPGVTVLDTVDVLGRPALALGLTTSDWLHEELLLDKETYAYRGERSTIVRDATIDPLKAGNATGQVRKGSTVVVARAATAIVDEPASAADRTLSRGPGAPGRRRRWWPAPRRARRRRPRGCARRRPRGGRAR
jgi:hypothetical protein